MDSAILLKNILTQLDNYTPDEFIKKYMNSNENDTHNVKFASTMIYLLADLAVNNMLYFGTVKSLFMKYLQFEKNLLKDLVLVESNMSKLDEFAEYYHYESKLVSISDKLTLTEKCTLSAYRLIAITKILELFNKHESIEDISEDVVLTVQLLVNSVTRILDLPNWESCIQSWEIMLIG